MEPAETPRLHPDLEPYLDAAEGFIRHRFCHSFYRPDADFLAMINAQYECSRDRATQAQLAGQWSEYVFAHEKPYRIAALLEVRASMTATDYWRLAADVWTGVENLWQHRDEIASLLSPDENDVTLRRQMMSDLEQARLDAMADVLELYRGCGDVNRVGWSWTLDRAKAEWFARRYAALPGLGGVLLTGSCSKSDVIAYFDRRNEAEIVIEPDAVDVLREDRIE